MRITSATPAFLALALGACVEAAPDDVETDDAEVAVHVAASAIPTDGECTHIVATRLSDFRVTEYRGPLPGASFAARIGEHDVRAVAYAEPCDVAPASPPWIADPQVADFRPGHNELRLQIRGAGDVEVVPEFDDDDALIVDDTTRIRTGRNGEDAAGADLSLDGWEVKRIALPAVGGGGAPSAITLFSFEGVGGDRGLRYSPRGLAQLSDGRLVGQISEAQEPMVVYDAGGQFVAEWPIVYAEGLAPWTWTDGLEAASDGTLIRTAYDAATGATAIELLEIRGDHVAVVQRHPLADDGYPVGVARVPVGYAITTLPTGGGSLLTIMAEDGAILVGPTPIPGSVEGLLVAADGRLGALDYTGELRMYDADSGAARPGEQLSYTIGADVSNVWSLAWDAGAGGHVALSGFRIVEASADFTTAADLPIDLSGYVQPTGVDVVPGADPQLVVADRVPPLVGGVRNPTIDLYDRDDLTPTGTVTLAGVSLPARTRHIAILGDRGQVASHYRRPGNPADPIDGVVYLHDLATGALVHSFDVAGFGFVRVLGVNYLPDTGELLIAVTDVAGTPRLVVTDATGQPRRSYRTDAIGGFTDLAPRPGGELGVVIGQPSWFVQAALP
jgi:hypothetical protein